MVLAFLEPNENPVVLVIVAGFAVVFVPKLNISQITFLYDLLAQLARTFG